MKSTVTTYIGVGSNLGDREAHIRRALAMLVETPGIEIRRISSFLTNPAQGGPDDAPEFLNCAVEAICALSARDLMKRLLEIEQQIGRIRREKWEPRVIDLDLLLYGNTILSGDSLIVPHPLMHERLFVLKPLAEIAPNALHPTLGVNVKTLLQKLETAVRD
ncbi:MAG: 2-amino-4-hydroxy-6-hydroxymethyldihydropteridine diphosphokinase [Tepidisphaerales bacterium]